MDSSYCTMQSQRKKSPRRMDEVEEGREGRKGQQGKQGRRLGEGK